MKKFKVGDIVRVRKLDGVVEIYKYINSAVKCVVYDVCGANSIRVEILDGYYKGDRYTVNAKNFYKVVNRTE